MHTVLELLNLSRDHLEKHGVEQPRLEAELLLGHILKKTRLDLYLDYNRPLEQGEVDRYREFIRRRAERKPLQYIVGETEFYGLTFKVNQQVLIPRPETEILAEKVIELVSENSIFFRGEIAIFDIGCGSGCIGVTLAKKLAGVKVYASDISAAALKVARGNAELNGVESKLRFLEGDLEQAFSDDDVPEADIVVSNVPYVSEAEWEELASEVKDFEPREALVGGADGLDMFRRLIPAGLKLLKNGGWLFLEIGYSQAESVVQLLEEAGEYREICFFEDYHGIKRVARARREDKSSG